MPIVHTVLWIKKLFWPNSVVICAPRVCFLVFNIICLLYVACDMLTALSFGEKFDSCAFCRIHRFPEALPKIDFAFYTSRVSNPAMVAEYEKMVCYCLLLCLTSHFSSQGMPISDLVQCFCQLGFV